MPDRLLQPFHTTAGLHQAEGAEPQCANHSCFNPYTVQQHCIMPSKLRAREGKNMSLSRVLLHPAQPCNRAATCGTPPQGAAWGSRGMHRCTSCINTTDGEEGSCLPLHVFSWHLILLRTEQTVRRGAACPCMYSAGI